MTRKSSNSFKHDHMTPKDVLWGSSSLAHWLDFEIISIRILREKNIWSLVKGLRKWSTDVCTPSYWYLHLSAKQAKSLSHVRLFATPTGCGLPVSSVHGVFQARILEWVAISFSRGSSRPRDRTQVSHITGRHFTLWATNGTCANGWERSGGDSVYLFSGWCNHSHYSACLSLVLHPVLFLVSHPSFFCPLLPITFPSSLFSSSSCL